MTQNKKEDLFGPKALHLTVVKNEVNFNENGSIFGLTKS